MSSNDDDEDRGTLSYLEPVSVEIGESSQRTSVLDLNKSYLDEGLLFSRWRNRFEGKLVLYKSLTIFSSHCRNIVLIFQNYLIFTFQNYILTLF